MNLIVKKTSSLQGQIMPPSSKSQSIRAIFFALLSRGESVLTNILNSSDILDAINVCHALGATTLLSEDTLIIKSNGLENDDIAFDIYTGNSGLTTYFTLPLVGLLNDPKQSIVLNCGEQMRKRPIAPFILSLHDLGLHIEYLEKHGHFPILVSGKLIGGKTKINAMTSQYLSALLMTLPSAEMDSEIQVFNLQERPYVNMTLDWLNKKGIQFKHEQKNSFDNFFLKGGQHYKNFRTMIPNDFSSAAFLIASAVLIPSEIMLEGLHMSDVQGDKQLIIMLKKMGADIVIEKDRLHIKGGKKLTGIKIDASDTPDLLPILAVIGTKALGKTEIYNVKHARIKETDRIHAMHDGLSRMGAHIEEHESGLTIYQSQLKGAYVKGYDDHRTVMALSVAGLCAVGETIIDSAEAINKTFPSFISVMKSMNANMEMQCVL